MLTLEVVLMLHPPCSPPLEESDELVIILVSTATVAGGSAGVASGVVGEVVTGESSVCVCGFSYCVSVSLLEL